MSVGLLFLLGCQPEPETPGCKAVDGCYPYTLTIESVTDGCNADAEIPHDATMEYKLQFDNRGFVTVTRDDEPWATGSSVGCEVTYSSTIPDFYVPFDASGGTFDLDGRALFDTVNDICVDDDADWMSTESYTDEDGGCVYTVTMVGEYQP